MGRRALVDTPGNSRSFFGHFTNGKAPHASIHLAHEIHFRIDRNVLNFEKTNLYARGSDNGTTQQDG